MKKNYSNRQMRSDTTGEGDLYFFPKNNPPVTIKAHSREEAEAKLAELKN